MTQTNMQSGKSRPVRDHSPVRPAAHWIPRGYSASGPPCPPALSQVCSAH